MGDQPEPKYETETIEGGVEIRRQYFEETEIEPVTGPEEKDDKSKSAAKKS